MTARRLRQWRDKPPLTYVRCTIQLRMLWSPAHIRHELALDHVNESYASSSTLQVLPEVTRERWEYGGEAKLEHETVDTWVFKSEPGKGYGHYASNYTLSVSKVGSYPEGHC